MSTFFIPHQDNFYYTKAIYAENAIDTMGAGDSYFSAFLSSLLETSKDGSLIEESDEKMKERLLTAMNKGAAFSAKVCAMEGAFGYGVPIEGKTEL